MDATVPSVYRPGQSFSSRPKREKNLKEVSLTEYLDLKRTSDQLYKEVERKEARNLALLKELQATRGNFASQQRELKIIRSMFEKIGSERNELSDEVIRNKEYINKLEVHVGRLENSQQLLDEIGQHQIANESLQLELQQAYVAVKDREATIEQAKYDNETLKRAIEVQIQFEGKVYPHASGGMPPNGGIGRDAMRALYFELGKRQADSHGLALSLAQSHKVIFAFLFFYCDMLMFFAPYYGLNFIMAGS